MHDDRHPAHTERLHIITSALRGVVAGATHAIISWLLDHFHDVV